MDFHRRLRREVAVVSKRSDLIAITLFTIAYPTIKERMGKAKYERPEDADVGARRPDARFEFQVSGFEFRRIRTTRITDS